MDEATVGRRIAWQLPNTLDGLFGQAILYEAEYLGQPEILNTDLESLP